MCGQEKAYAKLHGSFSSLSGWVDQTLADLSGCVGSRIDRTKDPAKWQIRTGQLFSQLLQYHQSGFLLSTSSPAGSDIAANKSADGILHRHAYAILDVQAVDGNQLLRLRNPWGHTEWTGDWSDRSAKWTRALKAKLNWIAAEDGAFWMPMVDFTRAFDHIYVCRFFDAAKGWQALEPIRGELRGPTAGGCIHYPSVKDSPQHLLTISEPTTIVFVLAQKDARGTSQKMKSIGMEVYNNQGRHITQTRQGVRVCASEVRNMLTRNTREKESSSRVPTSSLSACVVSAVLLLSPDGDGMHLLSSVGAVHPCREHLLSR